MLLAPSYIADLKWYLPDLEVSKIIVVPNAYVQPGHVDWEEKRNHLLYVGRIEQAQKNVMVLPEIWRRLHSEAPDWEFHIVGYGPDTMRLKKSFRERNCQNFYFHDRQRAEPFFEKASIFIMTSTYEGFANTLIEAQMHGVVPVAFRSFSAIDWMVNDSQDALVIAPYDLDKMSDSIASLISDGSKRNSMALAGLDNAKRFSEDTVGLQWKSILTELLDEN
jgi:glycosyltransferase involved in cell wall biosynthesis